MASSASVAPMPPSLTRDEVVPSRKRIKLPPWLEVAKPRLIPLLLATTLGGMALTEGWPLTSSRLACTLGGGALAAAAAGVLNCLWEQELDGRMLRTSVERCHLDGCLHPRHLLAQCPARLLQLLFS